MVRLLDLDAEIIAGIDQHRKGALKQFAEEVGLTDKALYRALADHPNDFGGVGG